MAGRGNPTWRVSGINLRISMPKISLKKITVVIIGLFLCFIAGWLIKVTIFKTSHLQPCEYVIPRKIQYHFTLQNKTDRVIKMAEF